MGSLPDAAHATGLVVQMFGRQRRHRLARSVNRIHGPDFGPRTSLRHPWVSSLDSQSGDGARERTWLQPAESLAARSGGDAEIDLGAEHRECLAPEQERLAPGVDRAGLPEREGAIGQLDPAAIAGGLDRHADRRDEALVRQPRPAEDEGAALAGFDDVPPDSLFGLSERRTRPHR